MFRYGTPSADPFPQSLAALNLQTPRKVAVFVEHAAGFEPLGAPGPALVEAAELAADNEPPEILEFLAFPGADDPTTEIRIELVSDDNVGVAEQHVLLKENVATVPSVNEVKTAGIDIGPSAVFHTFTGLNPGTQYFLYAVATDANGNDSPVTPSDPPSVETDAVNEPDSVEEGRVSYGSTNQAQFEESGGSTNGGWSIQDGKFDSGPSGGSIFWPPAAEALFSNGAENSGSVSLWFAKVSGTQLGTIMQVQQAGAVTRIAWAYNASQMRLVYGTPGASRTTVLSNRGFYADQDWHHIVMTLEGTTGRWYFDGAPNFTQSGIPINTADVFTAVQNGTNMRIRQVKFLDRVLTDAEVAEEFASTKPAEPVP